MAVDGAEDGGGVVAVDEGARAVINGLAGERHVVGIHHAVDEADAHPLGDERGLALDGFHQKRDDRLLGLRALGEVPAQGVIGEEAQGGGIAEGGEILEGADADVAGGDAGEDGPGEGLLAEDGFAGGGDGEAAGGGDAEGLHGFADEVFAQHRAEGGAAIAAARVGRGAGAFELDVEPRAGRCEVFAEQDGAAVAEPGEVAVLVAGVGLGEGRGAGGKLVAREKSGGGGMGAGVGIEAERAGERLVEEDEARLGDRGGGDAGVKNGREAGVGVVEIPAGVGCGCGGGGHGGASVQDAVFSAQLAVLRPTVSTAN